MCLSPERKAGFERGIRREDRKRPTSRIIGNQFTAPLLPAFCVLCSAASVLRRLLVSSRDQLYDRIDQCECERHTHSDRSEFTGRQIFGPAEADIVEEEYCDRRYKDSYRDYEVSKTTLWTLRCFPCVQKPRSKSQLDCAADSRIAGYLRNGDFESQVKNWKSYN